MDTYMQLSVTSWTEKYTSQAVCSRLTVHELAAVKTYSNLFHAMNIMIKFKFQMEKTIATRGKKAIKQGEIEKDASIFKTSQTFVLDISNLFFTCQCLYPYLRPATKLVTSAKVFIFLLSTILTNCAFT